MSTVNTDMIYLLDKEYILPLGKELHIHVEDFDASYEIDYVNKKDPDDNNVEVTQMEYDSTDKMINCINITCGSFHGKFTEEPIVVNRTPSGYPIVFMCISTVFGRVEKVHFALLKED